MQTGIAGCIDVETTGLSPFKDEIVELALVLFKYDDRGITGIIDSYSGLREPNCSISREAYRAHRLSRKMLKGHRLDNKKINNMIEQADFLVAHNASFDRGFVTAMLPSLNGKSWYCSMSGIKWSGGKSLQRLLSVHDIKVVQAHRALDDVHSVLNLLTQQNGNDRTYFAEMLEGKPLAEEKLSNVINESAKAEAKKSGCLNIALVAFLIIITASVFFYLS